MNSLKKLNKFLAGLVAVTFFTANTLTPSPLAFASVEPANTSRFTDFKIPSEYGKVADFTPALFSRDIFHDSSFHNRQKDDSRILIHIQEAHANYDAQNNIRNLLDYLAQNYEARLIFLEGSGDKLQPERLNFFPDDPELQKTVTERLMKAGELTGAEAFLIEKAGDTNVQPLALTVPRPEGWGVESAEAYRNNWELYKSVYQKREMANQFLEDFYLQWRKRASRGFDKNSRDFILRYAEYEETKISLEAWLETLRGAAVAHLFLDIPVAEQQTLETRETIDSSSIAMNMPLDLTDVRAQIDWPVLVRYFRLKEVGKEIDEAKVEVEKAIFLNNISAGNGPFGAPRSPSSSAVLKVVDEVQEIFHSAKTGNLPVYQTRFVFERLMDALPEDFSFDAYPNLRLYIQQMILMSEIDSRMLQSEMKELAKRILESLLKTDRERELVTELREYQLLKKLFHLELSRDEYEQEVRRKFAPEKLTSLSGMARGVERPVDGKAVIPVQNSALNALFVEAIQFYAGAIDREDKMMENAGKILGSRKDKVAVLITGGFHTDGFKKQITESGHSYVGITPSIGNVAREEEENYLRALLGTDGERVTEKTGAQHSPVNVLSSHIAALLSGNPDFMRQTLGPDYAGQRFTRIQSLVREVIFALRPVEREALSARLNQAIQNLFTPAKMAGARSEVRDEAKEFEAQIREHENFIKQQKHQLEKRPDISKKNVSSIMENFQAGFFEIVSFLRKSLRVIRDFEPQVKRIYEMTMDWLRSMPDDFWSYEAAPGVAEDTAKSVGILASALRYLDEYASAITLLNTFIRKTNIQNDVFFLSHLMLAHSSLATRLYAEKRTWDSRAEHLKSLEYFALFLPLAEINNSLVKMLRTVNGTTLPAVFAIGRKDPARAQAVMEVLEHVNASVLELLTRSSNLDESIKSSLYEVQISITRYLASEQKKKETAVPVRLPEGHKKTETIVEPPVLQTPQSRIDKKTRWQQEEEERRKARASRIQGGQGSFSEDGAAQQRQALEKMKEDFIGLLKMGSEEDRELRKPDLQDEITSLEKLLGHEAVEILSDFLWQVDETTTEEQVYQSIDTALAQSVRSEARLAPGEGQMIWPFQSVMHIAWEMAPFVKKGGLADVIGELPLAMKRKYPGTDISVIIPYHRDINLGGAVPVSAGTFRYDSPEGIQSWEAFKIEHHGLTVFLLQRLSTEHQKFAPLFQKGYQTDQFYEGANFSKAAVEFMAQNNIRPDIIHPHDQTAAYVPVILRDTRDSFFMESAVFYTAHHFAGGYQGKEDLGRARSYLTGLGLSAQLFNEGGPVVLGGRFNALRGASLYPDMVSTVSGHFAWEAANSDLSEGLQHVLQPRYVGTKTFLGITNAIDKVMWSSRKGAGIQYPFDPPTIEAGKRANKEYLQVKYGLRQDANAPLLSFVSRYDPWVKGFDIVPAVVGELLSNYEDLQVVFAGAGDSGVETALARLKNIYPDRVYVSPGFVDANTVRFILAGSDFVGMPSRIEPAGLVQQQGLLLGAVPIVTRVGGLEETVHDPFFTHGAGVQTGFKSNLTDQLAMTFSWACVRALEMFKTNRNLLTRIRLDGLDSVSSWDDRVDEYFEAYTTSLQNRQRFIHPKRSELRDDVSANDREDVFFLEGAQRISNENNMPGNLRLKNSAGDRILLKLISPERAHLQEELVYDLELKISSGTETFEKSVVVSFKPLVDGNGDPLTPSEKESQGRRVTTTHVYPFNSQESSFPRFGNKHPALARQLVLFLESLRGRVWSFSEEEFAVKEVSSVDEADPWGDQKEGRVSRAEVRSWAADNVPELVGFTVVSRQLEAGLSRDILDKLIQRYGKKVAGLVAATTVTGGLGALMHDLFPSWQKNFGELTDDDWGRLVEEFGKRLSADEAQRKQIDAFTVNVIYDEIKGQQFALDVPEEVQKGQKTLGDYLREVLTEEPALRFDVLLEPGNNFRSKAAEWIGRTGDELYRKRLQQAREAAEHAIKVKVYPTRTSVGGMPNFYVEAFYIAADGTKVQIFDEVYPDAPHGSPNLWRDLQMAVYGKVTELLTLKLQEKGVVKKDILFVDNEVFVSIPTPLLPNAIHHHMNHSVFAPTIYHPDEASLELLGYPKTLARYIVHDGRISIVDAVGATYDLVTGVALYEHTPAVAGGVMPGYSNAVDSYNENGLRSTNGVLIEQWQSPLLRGLTDQYKKKLGMIPIADDRDFFAVLQSPGNEATLETFKERTDMIKAYLTGRLMLWLKESQNRPAWFDKTLRAYQKEFGLNAVQGSVVINDLHERLQRALQDEAEWDSLFNDPKMQMLRREFLSRAIVSNVRRQVSYKGPDKWLEILRMLREDPKKLAQYKVNAARAIIGGREFGPDAHGLFLEIQGLIRELKLEDLFATIENYNIEVAPVIFQGVSGTVMITYEVLEASATSMMKALPNAGALVGAWGGSEPELFTIVNKSTREEVDIFKEKITYEQLIEKLHAGEWEITNGFLVEYSQERDGKFILYTLKDGKIAKVNARSPDANSMINALAGLQGKYRELSTRKDIEWESLKSSPLVDMEKSQARAHMKLWQRVIQRKESEKKLFAQSLLSPERALAFFANRERDTGFIWRKEPSAALEIASSGVLSFLESARQVRTHGADAYQSVAYHADKGEIFKKIFSYLDGFKEDIPEFYARMKQLEAEARETPDLFERVKTNFVALRLLDRFAEQLSGKILEGYITSRSAAYEPLLQDSLFRQTLYFYLESSGQRFGSLNKGLAGFGIELGGEKYLAALNINETKYPGVDGGEPKAWGQFYGQNAFQWLTGQTDPGSLMTFQVVDAIHGDIYGMGEDKKPYPFWILAEGVFPIGIPAPDIQILQFQAVGEMEQYERKAQEGSLILDDLQALVEGNAGEQLRQQKPRSDWLKKNIGALLHSDPEELRTRMKAVSTIGKEKAVTIFGAEGVRPVMAFITALIPDLLEDMKDWDPEVYRALSRIVNEPSVKELFEKGEVSFSDSSRDTAIVVTRTLPSSENDPSQQRHIVMPIHFSKFPYNKEEGKVWFGIGSISNLGLTPGIVYKTRDWILQVTYEKEHTLAALLKNGWRVGISVVRRKDPAGIQQSGWRFQVLEMVPVGISRSEAREAFAEAGRMITTKQLRLPEWVGEYAKTIQNRVFTTPEERMTVAVELSRRNVENETGGPFGAVVFDRKSGKIFSMGVNLVVPERASFAHAEMVALTLAQERLKNFSLDHDGREFELVTSSQPCAMCFGAIPWSGVKGVVMGARGSDVETITGFDEGPIHPEWFQELSRRGMVVGRDVLRSEAIEVLRAYVQEKGTIYNGKAESESSARSESRAYSDLRFQQIPEMNYEEFLVWYETQSKASRSAMEKLTVKIMQGIAPLLANRFEVIEKMASKFILSSEPIQSLREKIEADRFEVARRILGVKTIEGYDALVLTKELALDRKGLFAIQKVFGGMPVIVLADESSLSASDRSFLSRIPEASRPVFLSAGLLKNPGDLPEAVSKVLGRKSNGRMMSLKAMAGTTDAMATLLKQQLKDEVVLLTTSMFENFLSVAGVGGLVEKMQAEYFAIARSA